MPETPGSIQSRISRSWNAFLQAQLRLVPAQDRLNLVAFSLQIVAEQDRGLLRPRRRRSWEAHVEVDNLSMQPDYLGDSADGGGQASSFWTPSGCAPVVM